MDDALCAEAQDNRTSDECTETVEHVTNPHPGEMTNHSQIFVVHRTSRESDIQILTPSDVWK